MKILSIFVDESGDFGPCSKHSPYYIISMVFHDQSVNLSEQIYKLNMELANLGYYNHAIHTEPLIRREEDYKNISPNERRAIFSKLYYFVCRCNIKYRAFIFKKKEFSDSRSLAGKMKKEIFLFIEENLDYLQGFDKIILYYDNGQHELNQILHTVFSQKLTKYEVRKVLPSDYKLFQAADLICTLELMMMKISEGMFSKSEQLIFHSVRDFKKDYLKGIRKKRFMKGEKL